MKNIKFLKVFWGLVIVFVLMIPIFIFIDIENKNKAYDTLLDKIKTTTIEYINKNNNFDSGNIKVKLSDLKNSYLIDISIINPKTKRPLSNESYVIINSVNKDIIDIKLYDIPKKEKVVELIVSFNGEKTMQNGISVRYLDPGIKVLDGSKNIEYSTQYFLKGKEVIGIDSSRPRTYEVVYTAVNSKDELAKVVRMVIVQ